MCDVNRLSVRLTGHVGCQQAICEANRACEMSAGYL